MKKNTVLCLLFAGARCAFGATAFTDVSWNWNAHPGEGTSITNALDYFDASNWNDRVPVDSGTQRAVFTDGMSGIKYIKADRTVHVGNMFNDVPVDFTTNSSKHIVFVSDHPVVFNRGKGYQIPSPDGIFFYADVSWLNTWYPYGLIFCGDLANAAAEDFGTDEYSEVKKSLPFALGAPIELRYDLFAKNSDPVRTNVGGFTALTLNAGNLTVAAPRGSDEDVVGQWSQEEGSAYIFRTGAAHVLCAGTIVTGAGIPEGAFVKRIFSSGSVELSAKATSTIASNELTFKAFSPKVTQTPFSVYASQSGTKIMRFMKWRDQDEFTVPITGISTVAGDGGREVVFAFDVKENALPAKIVVENGTGMYGKLSFRNCHVELNATAFKYASDAQVPYEKSFARLSVTDGVAVSVANFSKIAGTLVKEDAGTLTLDLTGGEDAYTGTVVVKGGELVLSNAAEAVSISVSTLAVSNGATLRIPDCGIVCGSFSAEPGAVVAGNGKLMVTDFSDGIMNVVCTGGAKVVYADAEREGDIFIEPPATNVPGNPALWFDASKLDSLTYSTVDGTNFVSKWNDVRGEAVMSATAANPDKLPELNVTDDGKRNFVYFRQDNAAKSPAESRELVWSRKVENIVSVFKVLDCGQGGGGQFLGASELWRATENRSYSNPIIYKDASSASLLDASRFYVNGELRNWRDGYAYVGSDAYDGSNGKIRRSAFIPQVAELHLEGGTVSAGGFSAQTSSAAGRNGNQDLYELIVYTNRLTEAERLAVTGYLMKKWLNADVEFEVASNVRSIDAVSGGRQLGVDAGTKISAGTVNGAGTFSKTGAGELFLEDCHAPETTLEVREGRLSVRSALAPEESIPEGAVLHLDASDSSTYLGTHETGGNIHLTEWGDARGDGYGSVKVLSPNSTSSDHPKVVPGKLNGLAMVDFGTFGTKTASNMTGGVMRVSTFFTVQNSENGGGYLFGDTAVNCYTSQEDGHHGLIRNPEGTLAYPIIYGAYGKAAVCCFGPGATRVRLNGTEVTGTEAYYTGGNDLLTVQTYEQLIGNSITHGNCNNPVYGGGKMVGELIYYDRRLTDEETDRVEAYLRKKWFGTDTAAFTAANVAALDVEAGAVLAVCGNGPLVVGSIGGAGTVSGSLEFADGASWAVTADADGVSSSLSVTGTLDISGLSEIFLSGSSKPDTGSYVLVSASRIVGDLAGVVLDTSSASGRRVYRLRMTGGSIVLDVLPRPMTVILR